MKKLMLTFILMLLSLSSTIFAAGVQSLPLGFSILSQNLSVVNYEYASLPISNVKTPTGYEQLTPNGLVSPPSNPIFSYSGAVQTWVVPATGTYKLEVWGAQGGNGDATPAWSPGGLGGYAFGNISLTAGQTLNIYVGGVGVYTELAVDAGAGWNGGGKGFWAGGGGGASDIRIGGTALTNRVIVGGGGGGSWYRKSGGYGGGLIGGDGLVQDYVAYTITGGSQTSGGSNGGSLGKGADQGAYNGNYTNGGGGGGGYYGGGSTSGVRSLNTSGGGGSSYIGGVQNGGTTSGVQTGNGKIGITKVQ